MKVKQTLPVLVIMTAVAAQASVINLTNMTSNASDVLTTVTDSSGNLYNQLIAPTSLSQVGTPVSNPYVATQASGASLPTDVDSALGGLKSEVGALNYDFKAQFGGTLSDTSNIFLMNHTSASGGQNDNITVWVIDVNGDRISDVANTGKSVGGVFIRNTFELRANQTYNRTGGTTLASRSTYGGMFTLEDLGLDGIAGTAGIEIDAGSYDPLVVGLAVIPEPATLGILVALGVGTLFIRRSFMM